MGLSIMNHFKKLVFLGLVLANFGAFVQVWSQEKPLVTFAFATDTHLGWGGGISECNPHYKTNRSEILAGMVKQINEETKHPKPNFPIVIP